MFLRSAGRFIFLSNAPVLSAHGRDSLNEKVGGKRLQGGSWSGIKGCNHSQQTGDRMAIRHLARKFRRCQLPACWLRGVGPEALGVCWGRALCDSEVRANTTAPSWRRMPGNFRCCCRCVGLTHPEPSEPDIIFYSLLSDTDSHAGKRKHLLSYAAATSSAERSSQSFAS